MDTVLKILGQIKKTFFVPIHPAGWPFIVGFAVVSILLAMLAEFLGFVGLVLTLWCIYFFRDPVRVTPDRTGLLVSPADGIVTAIKDAPLPAELETDNTDDPLFAAKSLTRISIFLNVFDVHVNRNPIKGKVTQVAYFPGKFFNASLDKASVDNERNSLVVKIDGQPSSIAFVQIAGLVARRILCDAKVGDTLETGQRYGMIRFGSRVDIYLPPGTAPMVIEGQRMLGGETVIADMTSNETQRIGRVVKPLS